MRYLGIDYGMKNVGIALSDEEGKFALPETVFARQTDLVGNIARLIKEKGIGEIVIGESKDFSGNDNAIMTHLMKFKTELKTLTAVAIHLEPEFLSSHQASKLQGKGDNKSDKSKVNMIHASAAAIILQSFLDRTKAAKVDPHTVELHNRWTTDRSENSFGDNS